MNEYSRAYLSKVYENRLKKDAILRNISEHLPSNTKTVDELISDIQKRKLEMNAQKQPTPSNLDLFDYTPPTEFDKGLKILSDLVKTYHPA